MKSNKISLNFDTIPMNNLFMHKVIWFFTNGVPCRETEDLLKHVGAIRFEIIPQLLYNRRNHSTCFGSKSKRADHML